MSEKPCDNLSEDPNRRSIQTDEALPDCCTPVAPECNDPATCGPGCCAPRRSSHRAQWLISLCVMAAAAVVLVYGVLSREESAAEPARADGVVGVDAPGRAAAGAAHGDAGSTRDATFGSDGSDARIGGITQFASVIDMPEGSDALFVLLPGDDAKRTRDARDVLNAAGARIQEKGRTVAVRILQRGQDRYAELVEQFAVLSFPCVIAVGKGCGAEKVGEISEAHLIQAFVIASQPPAACNAGSACCPSPCGK